MVIFSSFGLLKSQAFSDSFKDGDLLAKCSGMLHDDQCTMILTFYPSNPIALEVLCAQKDEELVCKEQIILQLQHRLKAVEERHCHELMEFQVRAQQDAYVASYLGRQDRTRTQRRAKKN